MSHTKTNLLLTALVCAMGLQGCVNPAGLTHRETVVDVASLHSRALNPSMPGADAQWPQTQWWNSFADPQLDRLVAAALRDNPDLRQVQARVDKANAAAGLASADRGPSLDAGAGVARSRQSRAQDYNGQGDSYLSVRTLGVNFDYTLDLWGGKRSAWESAVDNARAAEVEQQSAKLLLAVDVVKAYNQLAYAWAVVDLSDRDLKRLDELVDLTGDRFHSGLDDRSQLERVQGLQARATATLLGAQTDVQVAQLQLSALLGGGTDGAQGILRPGALKITGGALPANVPAELLGRRPDIVAARWRVAAEGKNVDALRTRFYPNINLAASAGFQSLTGDSLTDTVSRFWSVGPTFSLPIFDAGRLRADYSQGNAELDLAIAHYNGLLSAALHQVASTLAQLRSDGERIALQRNARDTTNVSFELSVSRFKSGENNFLDSLTVEQQLIEDEMRLAQLSARQVDDSVALVAALGGGYGEGAVVGR
jgi:NodT family efflux transporter outer membrane factor (OMF) lipoprotein